MINAEKFKKEIMAMTDESTTFAFKADDPTVIRKCNDLDCHECLFNCGKCFLERTRWIVSEYKEPIKLTRLEHGILEYLFKNKQYKFIVRERNDCLYIYKSNPKKEVDGWQSLSMSCGLNQFNGLFEFVTWEDSTPTSIEEVLNNCEVVEDD